MKATDLMIGDWVQDYGTNHRYKITSIVDEDPYQVMDEDGLPTEIGSVEPIPLTEEMLIANGFEKYGNLFVYDKDSLYYKLGEGVAVEDSTGHYYNDKNICPFIEYVHTLQHALRLAGIEEIANNFKTQISL